MYCNIFHSFDILKFIRILNLQSIRNQTIMTHDPLPPEDSLTGYSRPDGYVKYSFHLCVFFVKEFYSHEQCLAEVVN